MPRPVLAMKRLDWMSQEPVMHPAGNLPSPRRRNGLRVALCANVQAPPLRLETTHLESWRTRKLVNLGEHRRLGGHLSDWLK